MSGVKFGARLYQVALLHLLRRGPVQSGDERGGQDSIRITISQLNAVVLSIAFMSSPRKFAVIIVIVYDWQWPRLSSKVARMITIMTGSLLVWSIILPDVYETN